MNPYVYSRKGRDYTPAKSVAPSIWPKLTALFKESISPLMVAVMLTLSAGTVFAAGFAVTQSNLDLGTVSLAPTHQLSGKVLGVSTGAYAYPTGSLVLSNGTIYFISGSTKVPFTSSQAFTGLGYSYRNVVEGDLTNYTLAQSYTISTANAEHPWGSWVIYRGTVYYSSQAGLIGVPSASVFVSNGGDWINIVKANKYDVAILSAHPNLPVLVANDPRVSVTPTYQYENPVNPTPVSPTSQPVLSKNSAFTNQAVSPNQTKVKIGSYTIQATSIEGLNVNTLSVGFSPVSGSAINPSTALANLYLVTPQGNTVPTNISSGNSNAFSVNFTVAANQIVVIDVYADVANSSGYIQTTLSVGGVGVTSNQAVNLPAQLGQSINILSSTQPLTVVLSTASPLAGNVNGGSMNQPIATYNLSGYPNGATVQEMDFSVTGTTAMPISAVSVSGVKAAVTGSTVKVTGLNISVPTTYSGIDVPVAADYAIVGINGVPSGTSFALTLTSVKYIVAGVVQSSMANVASNQMTLGTGTASTSATSPVITGPTSVQLGAAANYSFVSTDQGSNGYNGGLITYTVNWGDGTVNNVSNPLPSGTVFATNHLWSGVGPVIMTVTATPALGSPSTATLNIRVTQTSSNNTLGISSISPASGSQITPGSTATVNWNRTGDFSSTSNVYFVYLKTLPAQILGSSAYAGSYSPLVFRGQALQYPSFTITIPSSYTAGTYYLEIDYADTNGNPIASVTSNPIVVSVSGSTSAQYDYNNDGKVDQADFSYLFLIINKATGYTCPTNKTCDINGDGVLNITDLSLFAQINNLTILAPQISTFVATPSTITAGQSAVLTWSASGVVSMSIDNGVGQVASSATSVTVTPTQTTTYTFTVYGYNQAVATKTVTVTVTPAGNKYDYNNDGKVDQADLNYLTFIINNIPGYSCPVNKVCDVNGDGKVDLNDVIAFAKINNISTGSIAAAPTPSPASVYFSMAQSGPAPLPETVIIPNVQPSTLTVSQPLTSPWLTFGFITASGNNSTFTVALNSAGLSKQGGTYTTTITVSGNFTGSPIQIPVTLTVSPH